MTAKQKVSSSAATSTVIEGATTAGGVRVDVRLSGGRIVAVSERAGSIREPGDRIVDADGLRILPGLVDLHVHLREPGGEASETIDTGTRAAAAGGFTTVFAMANTNPVQDSVETVELVARRAREAGKARVQPIGAVTRGLEGRELSDMRGMAGSAAAVRVFSDDGKCVYDAGLMREALRITTEFGGLVAQHAQEPTLTPDATANEGAAADALGVVGWPTVAEDVIIARDVLLAQDVGARLHVCHVSTAGAVEVLRWAKKRGIQVTAEVTPHHLLLDDLIVRDGDPRYKVNPPLRSSEDRVAVREALLDGTIDIVATDHAPHPCCAKHGDWQHAAFGMVGLETALAVVQSSMIDSGMLDWSRIPEIMSVVPKRIGGVAGISGRIAREDSSRLGYLHIGQPADVMLYDEQRSHTMSVSGLRGKSVNSPFLGMKLPGVVHETWLGGASTYQIGETPIHDGELPRCDHDHGAGEHGGTR